MKILISINGKKYSEQAIIFAWQLLRSLKPQFIILYVLEPISAVSEQVAKKYLEKEQEVLAKHGIKVRTKLIKGQRGESIIKLIKTNFYDLLVLGARGTAMALRNLSEYNIGKLSDQLIQVINNSFLLVKNPKEQLRRVLICADGSADSIAAINFWGELNRNKEYSKNVQVDIINVIPEFYSQFKDVLRPLAEEQLKSLDSLPDVRTKYLFEARSILSKYGIKSQIGLREGNAAGKILEEAMTGYDLIVLGLRGRKSKRKISIGRQALEVARYAKTSVLIIKH
ncbi:MAG: universal stress protein [Patescibacteria group bacterium]